MPFRFLALAATLVFVAGLAPAAYAQKNAAKVSDAFFSQQPTVYLNLEIGPKEMDSLRRDMRKYVTANLIEGEKGEKVYKNIGIHLKGAAGSTRGVDDKAGITLNMDKFDGDDYFHGMDKFHLANSVQDPTYVSELICGEICRAAGLPASRVAHAVVSINGKRRGFYYLKEGYDSNFLQRHFKSKNGNFYDGGFLRDLDAGLEHKSGKELVKPQEDLKKLVAAAREGNPKERLKKMEAVLDMEKFITYLALESIFWDWDGYPMNRNNYRIYHDPATDKLTFIPSGMDQMFGDPNGPILPNFQALVARAVIDNPEGRERYFKRMDELLKTVARPEPINKRLDEIHAKVQPEMMKMDQGLGRDFTNQVNGLKARITQRLQKLDAEMKQMNEKKK